MKLSEATDSVYRRYEIISDNDLTESMNRVQEHLKKEQRFGRFYRSNDVDQKVLSQNTHKRALSRVGST